MKALLTGATGFLGRYVDRSLQARGIETILLGRDLLDRRYVNDVVGRIGATHLVHLAWYVEHGQFWTSPLNADWVAATAHLAEVFCKAGGRRIVGAGTCFEYIQTDQPAVEDVTPIAPRTPYGLAKDEARRRVAEICARHGAGFAWGRIFVPYGTGEGSRRLLPSLIAALKGEREAFGVNREAKRDFIHAADLGEAFAELTQADASGAFNVAAGEGVRVEDLVREVAAQLGVDPGIILALPSARPGEPAAIIGCSDKLRALGWSPKIDLPEGVRRSLANQSAP